MQHWIFEEVRNILKNFQIKQVSDDEYEGYLGVGDFPFFLWTHSIVIVQVGVYEDEYCETEDEKYSLYLWFSCPTTDKLTYGFNKDSSSKDLLIKDLTVLVENLNSQNEIVWSKILDITSKLQMEWNEDLLI